MKLLIMGPPGSGKGTQATSIARHYQIPAISTGAIFRENIANKTELGLQVAQIIESGNYVPDDVTIALVKERLTQPDTEKGWLLDGFPRTVAQVKALDEIGESPDLVLVLQVAPEVLVDRMLRRAEVEGRADDNEETIRHRFKIYAEQTDPLLDIYRERGILVEVDGVGSVAEVDERILSALRSAKLEK